MKQLLHDVTMLPRTIQGGRGSFYIGSRYFLIITHERKTSV